MNMNITTSKRRIFSFFLMINDYFNFFIDWVAIASLWYAFIFLSFGCIYDFADHFYEISAVYNEKIGDFILASDIYNSVIPPVFKSKRLSLFGNYFSTASVVYFKPSDVIRSSEPDEQNTEYTGAQDETENEFERARHAELDAMLDRLHPQARPADEEAPSTEAVEDWLESLEKEGVEVGTGRGYSSELGEETLHPQPYHEEKTHHPYPEEEETFYHETKEGEKALQPSQERELEQEQEQEQEREQEQEQEREQEQELEQMDIESESEMDIDSESESYIESESEMDIDSESENDTDSESDSDIFDLFDLIAGNSSESDPK